MTRQIHIGLDLRGAIRNGDLAGFTKGDGKPASRSEALDFLLEQIALGRRVIPFGECDLWNYQTGCPGHPTP